MKIYTILNYSFFYIRDLKKRKKGEPCESINFKPIFYFFKIFYYYFLCPILPHKTFEYLNKALK